MFLHNVSKIIDLLIFLDIDFIGFSFSCIEFYDIAVGYLEFYRFLFAVRYIGFLATFQPADFAHIGVNEN